MGNDAVCKTVGIGNICMGMFEGLNPHEHALCSRFKKESLSLGVLETQGCKFSGADSGIKVTKGSIMIIKGERSTNLHKMIESVIVSDASVAIKKEDTTRLWHMHFIQERVRSSNPAQKSVLLGIKYCKLGLYKFFLSWVDSVE